MLSESIRKLSNEGVSMVVEHLKTNFSEALAEVDTDKMRILVNNIDKTTYLQLSEIIKKYGSKHHKDKKAGKGSINDETIKSASFANEMI